MRPRADERTGLTSAGHRFRRQPLRKGTRTKKLRFKAADGVWRVAFAFDPERQAILLVAGNKAGVKEKRFYKQLITKADERFDSHLNQLKGK